MYCLFKISYFEKIAEALLVYLIFNKIYCIFFFLLMGNILYTVDFFKTPVAFQFSNHEKHSTILGGLISLAILAYIITIIAQSDMINKTNPFVSTKTDIITNHPEINIDLKNQPFVSCVADDYNYNYHDPTIFKIMLYVSSYDIVNGVLNETYYPTRQCEELDFKEKEGWSKFNYTNVYCPTNDITNLDLEGFWDQDYLKYFGFVLMRCEKNENFECKSESEINTYLSNKIFSVMYSSNLIDPSNFHRPFSTIKKTYYRMIENIYKFKLSEIYVKKITMYSEEDSILENQIKYENFQYSSRELQESISLNPELIALINFYSDFENVIYVRKYQKIQDLLAKIGGIISVLIGFLQFFIGFYRNHALVLETLNKIYIFPSKEINNNLNNNMIESSRMKSSIFQNENCLESHIDETKNHKINVNSNQIESEIKFKRSEIILEKIDNLNEVPSKNSKIIEFKFVNQKLPDELPQNISKEIVSNEIVVDMIQEKNKVNEIDEININTNSPIIFETAKEIGNKKKSVIDFKMKTKSKQLLNLLNQTKTKENQLKMNIGNKIKLFIKSFFKIRLNYNERLFKKGDKMFQKDLNLIELIKRLKDIEKLKIILLNEDQLTLFNNLGKPMIYEKSNNFRKQSTLMSDLMGMNKIDDTAKELRNIVNSFENLKNLNVQSNIDKKLLIMMEEQINEFQRNL